MSQRRVKSIRRTIKKNRQALTDDTWKRTLELPFAKRFEIATNLLTKNRPVIAAVIVFAVTLIVGTTLLVTVLRAIEQ